MSLRKLIWQNQPSERDNMLFMWNYWEISFLGIRHSVMWCSCIVEDLYLSLNLFLVIRTFYLLLFHTPSFVFNYGLALSASNITTLIMFPLVISPRQLTLLWSSHSGQWPFHPIPSLPTALMPLPSLEENMEIHQKDIRDREERFILLWVPPKGICSFTHREAETNLVSQSKLSENISIFG